jgi:hypothetical protein
MNEMWRIWVQVFGRLAHWFSFSLKLTTYYRDLACVTYEAVNAAFSATKLRMNLPGPKGRSMTDIDVDHLSQILVETSRNLIKEWVGIFVSNWSQTFSCKLVNCETQQQDMKSATESTLDDSKPNGPRLNFRLSNYNRLIYIFQSIERYNLHPDAVHEALPLIDTQRTVIDDFCPAYLNI